MFGRRKVKTPTALSITARKVQFDYLKALQEGAYWHSDDPVLTHFFNGLQAMFPEGERFFMDSARDVRDWVGRDKLPNKLLEQIQLFIRQEALHGKEHDKWTQALIDQGYETMRAFDERLKRDNAEARKKLSPLLRLSMTAASEHFTASMAHLFVYHRPDLIENAKSPFRELLLYHALEEVEHKGVCYDLYQAAGGGYFMRAFGMVFVTVDLIARLRNRQAYLLKKDGLWNPQTKKKMNQLYWGKGGLFRELSPFLLQYFKPWFHPWETDERQDLIERFRSDMKFLAGVADR